MSKTKYNKIQTYIETLKPINSAQDYDNFIDFFLSKEQQDLDSRMALYEKIKLIYQLKSLSEAKQKILKDCLSSYIYETIQKANQLSFDLMPEAEQTIEHIYKIAGIFKEYDQDNAQSFILSSVEDMNLYEFNGIFQNMLSSSSFELSEIEKQLLKDTYENSSKKQNLILSSVQDIQKYKLKFLNHPLIDLYQGADKNADNLTIGSQFLGKYSNLVQNLQKFYNDKSKEQFRGAVTFLIHLDITQGLQQVKEPKELTQLLEKLNDTNMSEEAFNQLCEYSSVHSENFILDKNGQVQFIQNNNKSHNIGVCDRKFDNVLFFDKSNAQNNQLSRAISDLNRSSNNTASLFATIQACSDFSISSKLSQYNEDNDTVLSNNELMIVSYAENFSSLLKSYSLKKISNEQLLLCPVELYGQDLKQSVRFNKKMAEFNNTDSLIYEYTTAFFSTLDNYNLLLQSNKNFQGNIYYQSVIKTSMDMFSSLSQIIDKQLVSTDNLEQMIELKNFCGSVLEKLEFAVEHENLNAPDSVLEYFQTNAPWLKYKNEKPAFQNQMLPFTDLIETPEVSEFVEKQTYDASVSKNEKAILDMIDKGSFDNLSFIKNKPFKITADLIDNLKFMAQNIKLLDYFTQIAIEDLNEFYNKKMNKNVQKKIQSFLFTIARSNSKELKLSDFTPQIGTLEEVNSFFNTYLLKNQKDTQNNKQKKDAFAQIVQQFLVLSDKKLYLYQDSLKKIDNKHKNFQQMKI